MTATTDRAITDLIAKFLQTTYSTLSY